MLILDLWGISFHAVVVLGLGKNILFKSILGRCDMLHNSKVGNANCQLVCLYLNKYCKLWHNRYNLVFRSRQLLRETKNCFHLYLHKIKYTIPLGHFFLHLFSLFYPLPKCPFRFIVPAQQNWMNGQMIFRWNKST